MLTGASPCLVPQYTTEIEDASSNSEAESLLLHSKHGKGQDLTGYTREAYGAVEGSGTGHHIPFGKDQDAVCGSGHEKKSKFLGGVSNARFWVIFTCVAWCEFVASFDSTLMASSHPFITSYFHASESASWLSTAFLVTTTAFMPLFAPLSDNWGRRFIWLISSIFFGLSIVCCAVAPNIGAFIAARAVCGLGAGGIVAMGTIICNDLVPTEIRTYYESILCLVYGLGQALGAASGGILCDTIGWRWAFGIQVPPVIISAALAFTMTPNDLGPQFAKQYNGRIAELLKNFDLQGSTLLALSITCFIIFLNVGGNILPWTHPWVLASITLSGVCLFFLIRVESRAYRPVLPLKYLFKWPVANANYAALLGYLITNAILFNIPFYYQIVRGETATMAGFRLVGSTLALTVAGLCAGLYISSPSRIPPTMIGSACLMFVGVLGLSFIKQESPLWISQVFLVAPSLGQGAMIGASFICILLATPKEEHAVVASTIMLWRRLGSVMGVAVSTLVVQNGLLHYMAKTVTGPHKSEIIARVHKSVLAVHHLSPLHRNEVIAAFSSTIRIAFAAMIPFAILAIVLSIPIQTWLNKDTEENTMEEE